VPRIPLKWLAESVDLVDDAPEAVAAALVKVGLEEEGIHGGGMEGPLVVGRVLSVVKEEQSNGKTINYCRVDVGELNDPAGPGHKPDNTTEWPASRGIVCGAHNFAEGDYVVCILPGGVLPGPFPISGRKTYGHWSDGMICSAKELGVGDDHAGIIVLASPSGESEDLGYAVDELTPGQDAIALLGLDEKTIEVTITPDRGYCFSIRGVAREYSHSTGATFRDPAGIELTGTPLDPSDAAFAASSAFPILIEDQAPIRGTVGCDRFAARALRGFNPGAPSPAWMKRRLEQSGMRSISLAVDVTNYVMLELGHPLHAYDLAKVTAPIVVRRASAGVDGTAETLVTLDDVTRELSPEDILVCDSVGGHGARPVGMGGVMGGLETEISATTSDVLLEAAHWDPITIARTARRHKLGSEASRRYERGVDTALAPAAIERALGLMKEFGGGEIEDQYTDIMDVEPRTAITMDVDFPSTIIGMAYSADEVVDSLTAVGCAVLRAGGVDSTDELTVTPPSWRPDLDSAITLVEEVARLHGYADIPSVLPVAPPGRGLTHGQKVRRSVARSLADAGLTEVLTYPFMAESRLDECLVPAGDKRRKLVRLANPLAAEKPVLRPRVLFTLFDAVKVNLGRGAQDVAVFELGRAYLDTGTSVAGLPAVDGTVTDAELADLDAALPEQLRMAAGIMAGSREVASWNQKAQPWEWTDALAMVETVAAAAGVELTRKADAYAPWHPGRTAVFALPDGTPCAHAGELHPKVCETLGLPARSVAFQILLDPIIAFTEGSLVAAEAVNPQVLAKEDFAFVVPETVTAGGLVACVLEAGGALVEDVRVFDVYAGSQVEAGHKSMAVNVRMRAADHTLSADEVLGVREAVIAAATGQLGAVLR